MVLAEAELTLAAAEVWEDDTRFKVVAAGRRTGKSRLAAWRLIISALSDKKGQVFYVAPTQGQARDIMWQLLLELGHDVIASAHVNNLQIKLVNGCTISLKGADRPETMRGVSSEVPVYGRVRRYEARGVGANPTSCVGGSEG